MTVRAAVAADRDAVVRITAASPTAPQWTEAEIAAVLAGDGDGPLERRVLVAEVDDNVAGFAVYTALRSVFPPECELESLAVAPEWRRRGAARALMSALERTLARLGAESIHLEVRASNEAALALYASVGFERTGIRRGYYATPTEDGICMQRRIPRGD